MKTILFQFAFNLNPRGFGSFKWFDRKRKIVFALVLGLGLVLAIASLASPVLAAPSHAHKGGGFCEGEPFEDSC